MERKNCVRSRCCRKQRDSETGLDYFGARYYGSNMGRFTSPDQGPYDLKNPQSLNRYTYGLNNPLKFVDPDGNMAEYVIDPKKHTITFKLKIAISGPGATQKYADKMKAAIEKAWKGTYTDKNGQEWTVSTQATVDVYNANTGAGVMAPNQFYVAKGASDQFKYDVNTGSALFPRYEGSIDPNDNAEAHEAGGHPLGLGDDYYFDTGQPVPGHAGHLMAGSAQWKSTRAAQDEMDRLAGYVVSTGKMQGTVVVLPGSKTSMQRTAERMDNENKRK